MAPAFYECSRASYYEIIEFLLHRYGSLDAFNGMRFIEFVKFYNVAQEKKMREELYQAWVVCLPNMDKEHFIPFEEYYRKCTGANVDNRPKDEILAEVEEIRRKVKENGNINI